MLFRQIIIENQQVTAVVHRRRTVRRDDLQAHGPAFTPVVGGHDRHRIPGGNAVVSMCHVCRTVCRRAERAALRADEKYGTDAEALMFLNRLSDYFYALVRMLTAHYEVDETLWIP